MIRDTHISGGADFDITPERSPLRECAVRLLLFFLGFFPFSVSRIGFLLSCRVLTVIPVDSLLPEDRYWIKQCLLLFWLVYTVTDPVYEYIFPRKFQPSSRPNNTVKAILEPIYMCMVSFISPIPKEKDASDISQGPREKPF